MVEQRDWRDRAVVAVVHALLVLVALAMAFPVLHVFAVSFSTFEDVARGGLLVWPRRWSLDAYRYVLGSPIMIRSFRVSVFLATIGTLVNLLATSTMACALANRNLLWRRFFLTLVLIPVLFWPGMIPRYLIVKATGLINSLWALIIPSAISPFNLLVMRNFFMDLPPELEESASLDGANDLQILWHIVLPVSKPVLAAMGLFYAVGHWNDYFAAVLYLSDPAKWPIQVLMRLIVLMGESEGLGSADVVLPTFTVRMSTVIVATVPILLVYPLLQRYFVKGVLTGAIKG